jgi:hypothetical protein
MEIFYEMRQQIGDSTGHLLDDRGYQYIGVIVSEVRAADCDQC